MPDNDYIRKDLYDAEQSVFLVMDEKTNKRIDDLKDSVSRQINLWGITISVIAALFAAMQIGLAIVLYFLTQTPGG